MKHARVLKWVNRIRKEYLGKGPIKRMPRGLRGSQKSCPLHNALWPSRTGGRITGLDCIPDGCGFLPLPNHIVDFVYNFDAGKYPELIKE